MADEARRKPIEDVSEISAITYGFMASKALFAALEFDLFTHIAQGADSSGALAKVSGIAENRLVTLLTALKSLVHRLIEPQSLTEQRRLRQPFAFAEHFQSGHFGLAQVQRHRLLFSHGDPPVSANVVCRHDFVNENKLLFSC